MRAHGASAFIRAPWVALVRIWVRVVLNFIIPRLDMESWRAIPEGAKARQSLNHQPLLQVFKQHL